MDVCNIAVFLLVFFVLYFQHISCIRLGNEEELLLRQVLHEFETVPEDGRFDRTIEIQYKDAKLIPKILIWCPIRHNGLTINCPVHNCPLWVNGQMCLMVLEQIPEIRGSSMIYMEILCWYKPSMSAAADYQDTRKVVIGIYPHPTRFCDFCHPVLQICYQS